MLRLIDDDEKLTSTILRAGQRRECNFLTEDGLYEVLFQSRKPIAKQFKKGVKEILKSIRKTGQYSTKHYKLPQTYLEALEVLVVSEREKERLRLESEEPEFKGGNSRLLESGDYKDFAIWLT